MPIRKYDALVLSGGSSKGALQIGILQYLKNKYKDDFSPTNYYGISTGALTAFMAAQDQLDILEKEYRKIKNFSSFFSGSLLNLPSTILLGKDALFGNEKLFKLINDNLDVNLINSKKRNVFVGTTCLQAGQYKLFDHNHKDFNKAILASTAIPLVFEPVIIDGLQYVDGGLIHQVPLQDAIDAGCRNILVVLTTVRQLAPQSILYDSGLSILGRTLDITYNSLYNRDVDIADEFSFVLHGDIIVDIIAPKINYIKGTIDFDAAHISSEIAAGCLLARDWDELNNA